MRGADLHLPDGTVQLSDTEILAVAVSLLEEGKSVILPATGDSMRPFVRGGRDKVLLEPLRSGGQDSVDCRDSRSLSPGSGSDWKQKSQSASFQSAPFQSSGRVSARRRNSQSFSFQAAPFRKGDIVLAVIPGGRTVLHRVCSVGADGWIVLMGDGNLSQRERCRAEDAVAIVSKIISPSRTSIASSRTERLKASLWQLALPLRPLLLKFFP